MGALLLGTTLVVTGALLFASLLRLESAVSFLLAAYLLAWCEVVAVVFSLSAGRWVECWTILAGLAVVAGVAAFMWVILGRPRPPPLALAARNGWRAAADPLVAIPLVVSATALVYTLVVSVTTAPNDGDPLAYELTRAAFWRQEHGIVSLRTTYVPLDFWPPVAETGNLAVMTLSGSDRFTGLIQWLSVPALALATYGVGRRVALGRRAALWAAALVPTFPVVIAQSWSAFTDLVFASFVVTSVYFGIGALGIELVPLALAVGLAMGTKFLGPIFAPLFALIIGVAQPVRRWPYAAAAALSGAGVASVWYLRTQFETGHPIGNGGAGVQSHELAPVVTTFELLTAEVFDLSGVVGRDEWLFAVAAMAIGAVALVTRRWHRIRWPQLLALVLLVALSPYVVSAVGRAYARGGLSLGRALGRPDLVDQLRDWKPSDVSDGAYSWFGPIGAVLAFGAVVLVLVEARKGRLPHVAIALAAAPLLAISLVSLTVAYQHHQGRYFIAAFALCLATCGGFALRHRSVGLTVDCVAAVTVLLVLVNSLGKPSGVGLLHGDHGRSAWSMPRWEQQGILRSTPPERDEVMTFRFVEEHVPPRASLGVALAYNSFMFPYFGRRLERTLTIVDEGDVLPADIDWLVASPDKPLVGCRDAWTRVRLGSYGWSVWRRTSADTCSTPEPLG
jgi:4-amino-4-deoxy-L-arabinose transferase-like glycosyltransferase